MPASLLLRADDVKAQWRLMAPFYARDFKPPVESCSVSSANQTSAAWRVLNGIALHAGSDIGFWSESGFADNLTLRNNHFTHSVTGANEMTWGSDSLGAISVGVSLPEGVNGFPNSFQNRNVTIEGNRIDDSYITRSASATLRASGSPAT
ncbi:MAG TPA: hypothetical protein VGJ20_17035 [Xanthobacteraceae bacterium]|jgi:hypothetical protein